MTVATGGDDVTGGSVSLPGEPSRAFGGLVGHTYRASEWPLADLLIDRARYTSEGDWAFCRFTSEAVPAVRMGYQAGSFDIGADERPFDADLLQLHVEVMTAEGGLLWVPTGRFAALDLKADPAGKDVSLAVGGHEIFSVRGWPSMEWHFRSDEDELEVRLEVDVSTLSVLPDCLLPHSVFAMWETMCRARGSVRVGDRTTDVDGHVFYDHTRVEPRRHDVRPRQWYLYTTLTLEDGSGLFGYHAEHVGGQAMDYYCFGLHVGTDGRGTFLPEARLTDLELDADGLPRHWRLEWRGQDARADIDLHVRPLPLARGWGGPSAPRSRASYVIFPLVLDATVSLGMPGSTVTLRGTGLAEYYDADAWGV